MNEPTAPDLVPVRQLVVCMDAGIPEQTLTLYEDDTVAILPGRIEVTLAEGPEVITFATAHVRWHSIRHTKGHTREALKLRLEQEAARQRRQARPGGGDL